MIWSDTLYKNRSWSRVAHKKGRAAQMLALEELLVQDALDALKQDSAPAPIVWTYQFSLPTVVLGNGFSVESIDQEYCLLHGIDVTKRRTGGGNVVVMPEDISYSFVFPERFDISQERFVHERLREALLSGGVDSTAVHEPDQSYLRAWRGGVEKSFVFPAMRRYNGAAYWHHGFVTVTDESLEHVRGALRASEKEYALMRDNNHAVRRDAWSAEAFLDRLAPKGSVQRAISSADVVRAQSLVASRYANPAQLASGSTASCVCNVPDGTFDRRSYTTKGLKTSSVSR